MTKPLSEMTNEELWQLFPIELSDHRDEWKQWYEDERDSIIRLIGMENVIRISHIGSTSVPGLIAKPTIDILLEIADECSTQKLKETFEQNGYIFSSQPDNPPPHITFLKGYTSQGFAERVFHIHVRYKGDWDELYFCEFLRVHPDMATQYGELKLQLKQSYEHDRDAYTEAKTEFVQRVTSLARNEQKQSEHRTDTACSVGIIGGADGPTAVFIGKRSEEKKKQWNALLAACKQAAVPVKRRKTGDELKAYLIETLGAVAYEPMPHALHSLKINALMKNHPEALQVPKMPDENAAKEIWLEWAKQSHMDYNEAAKRLPDDAFGFRYAFLSLPRNEATKAYYRAQEKESRMGLGLFARLKRLLVKRQEVNEITLDIELSTGYFTMGNGCAQLINELVLWCGVTQRDIEEQTPEFVAYASAMKDTGQINL